MSNIIVDNIYKRFKTNHVLNGLSFTCENEILFLAGRNGAGKTTFIRIALELEKATQGRVLYGGKAFSRVREKTGVVFDETGLYQNMSGEQNINILCTGYLSDKEYIRRVKDDLQLDRHLLKSGVSGYSFGQRHRLCFAIAIIKRPQYLFLDEPTIGLDPLSWQCVREYLMKIKNDGGCIIVTGQDYKEMRSLADKIVVLHDGTASYFGGVNDFLSDVSEEDLESAFVKVIGGNTDEK